MYILILIISININLHYLFHKELCLAIRICAAPSWVFLVYRKVFWFPVPFMVIWMKSLWMEIQLKHNNYDDKEDGIQNSERAMTANTVAEEEKTIFFTPNSIMACDIMTEAKSKKSFTFKLQ